MKLRDFLDVSQAPDESQLQGALVRFTQAMDFGLVSAALIVGDFESPDVRIRSVGNTPEAYIEGSKSLPDARRDPLLRRLMRVNVPLIYDEDFYTGAGVGDLYDAQSHYGYKTGIAVAIHMANERHFLFGIDRDRALPQDDDVLARMLADVQLLAVHAQDAAQRLFIRNLVVDDDQPNIQLTAREREVMRWTLAGKTAWEVGALLNISQHTARFHIRSVMVKLDASTKQQAALQCSRLGLL